MRKIQIILTIVAMLIGLLPAKAFAIEEDAILISELSMGSATSATEEFVELYNNSDSDVVMNGWSIYYKSASGSTWSKKASLTATHNIASKTFFVVATNSPADAVLISGMAQSGGVVELRNEKGEVQDRVGYGGADTSQTRPAVACEAGESIYRNFDVNENILTTTNDNLIDFNISTTPTPGTPPAQQIEVDQQTIQYPYISINELFADPGEGMSDSSDEYIELYNPNSFDVDLTGWVLKDASGSSYIIKNTIIGSNSHAIFYSADSKITLNNTGDIVQLYDPTGELVDESQDYGSAKEGLSWGIVNGAWDWNAAPTPANTNSTVYVATVSSATAKKAIAKKKATVKKKAVAKKAAAKKPKASKIKAASAASNLATSESPNLESKLKNFWPWLLIFLGTATIGYGIYEYRPEITNTYYKLKAKFGSSK